MIWLTWRQLRTQVAFAGGGIAILALLLVATGPGLARQFRAEPAGFLDGVGGGDRALYLVATFAVLALPALLGLFWGAPLITRELDTGTWQLAWTLTTRRRWLLTKLVLVGLVAMTAAGVLSLAVSWWASPIDTAIAQHIGLPPPGLLVFPRLSREIFDSRGIVPFGYAAFAFILGVTLGVMVRRTLPAMALFLAIFAVTQVFVSVWVRPALIRPDTITTVITTGNLESIDITNSLTVLISKPGIWETAQETVNRAGQPARAPASVINCALKAGPGQPGQHCLTRLAELGYRQRISYEPASRFWPLQLAETALYLMLTLLLAAGCTVLVSRRLR